MSRQNRCSKWIRKSTRFAIYHRDGFKCVYCKSNKRLTLDHFRPGNDHRPCNLLTACISCNAKRKNKTIREWFRELRLNCINTEAIRSRIWRRLSKPLDRAVGLSLAKECKKEEPVVLTKQEKQDFDDYVSCYCSMNPLKCPIHVKPDVIEDFFDVRVTLSAGFFCKAST